MKRIEIEGGHTLTGEIKISGAKNSAVALVPASILSDGIVKIDNIPDISDINALEEILEYLGASFKKEGSIITIDPSSIENKEIPEAISVKLRASYYFMAALLGKYKHVEMYFPGGCNIGSRPIDQTLKAFEELNAKVENIGNKYIISAEELIGGHVYLDMPSVGATVNTILAATLAVGTTILENAAKEPEIVNVATFLNNMGAKITGAGTSIIKIEGVKKLNGCYTEVIPDRIEAGTYVIAGALLGENLKISNIIPEHIKSLTSKLEEMGANMTIGNDYITINKIGDIKRANIKTLGYPGFPTDLQQPMTVLLALANGTSYLDETIYENRFQNVPYLNMMGANIEIIGQRIKINGVKKLYGKDVLATDLRAGACMLLAGLKANGVTRITQVEHLLRGYENIILKLSGVGAKIKLEEI